MRLLRVVAILLLLLAEFPKRELALAAALGKDAITACVSDDYGA